MALSIHDAKTKATEPGGKRETRLMNLRERLPQTFRAIDSFHDLIFSSTASCDEAIRWVHQQLEQACELVPSSDVSDGTPHLVWRPDLETNSDDSEEDDDCNLVFLLTLLHESLGGKRPPRLKPKPADLSKPYAVLLRWAVVIDRA